MHEALSEVDAFVEQEARNLTLSDAKASPLTRRSKGEGSSGERSGSIGSMATEPSSEQTSRKASEQTLSSRRGSSRELHLLDVNSDNGLHIPAPRRLDFLNVGAPLDMAAVMSGIYDETSPFYDLAAAAAADVSPRGHVRRGSSHNMNLAVLDSALVAAGLSRGGSRNPSRPQSAASDADVHFWPSSAQHSPVLPSSGHFRFPSHERSTSRVDGYDRSPRGSAELRRPVSRHGSNDSGTSLAAPSRGMRRGPSSSSTVSEENEGIAHDLTTPWPQNAAQAQFAPQSEQAADSPRSPQEGLFRVRVECTEKINGEEMIESKLFDVNEFTPVEDLLRKACRRFCKWDHWRYALYVTSWDSWLHSDNLLGDHHIGENALIQLRVRCMSYFVTPSTEPTLHKDAANKSFSIFSKGSKIEKKLKKGHTYLSLLLFRADKSILLTSSGRLPTVAVVKDETSAEKCTLLSDNFHAMTRQSKEWEQHFIDQNCTNTRLSTDEGLSHYDLEMAQSASPAPPLGSDPVSVDVEDYLGARNFTKALARSVDKLKRIMCLEHLGHYYEEPLQVKSTESAVFLAIRYVHDPDAYLQGLSLHGDQLAQLKWRDVDKIDTSVYDPTWSFWESFEEIHDSARNRVPPGLYVGLFSMVKSMTGGYSVLVPKINRQMIPLVKVRDAPLLLDAEWEIVRKTEVDVSHMDNFEVAVTAALSRLTFTDQMKEFETSFLAAAHRLAKTTGQSITSSNLYNRGSVCIDRWGRVRVITYVIMTGFEEAEPEYNQSLFTYYPLPLFEILHHHVYKNAEFMEYLKTTVTDKRIMNGTSRLSFRSSAENVLAEAKKSLAEERQRWRAMSWALTLIEWQRSNAWKSRYQNRS